MEGEEEVELLRLGAMAVLEKKGKLRRGNRRETKNEGAGGGL